MIIEGIARNHFYSIYKLDLLITQLSWLGPSYHLIPKIKKHLGFAGIEPSLPSNKRPRVQQSMSSRTSSIWLNKVSWACLLLTKSLVAHCLPRPTKPIKRYDCTYPTDIHFTAFPQILRQQIQYRSSIWKKVQVMKLKVSFGVSVLFLEASVLLPRALLQSLLFSFRS